MTGNQKVVAEATALNQSALITMYVLDCTRQGGDVLRFYPGTKPNGENITWQGSTYIQYPIESKGWEMKSSGAYPNPELIFSNAFGYMSALVLAFNDLLGCRVIRKRTFYKFLDGQPEADPTAEFPDDIFLIDRKTEENKSNVIFTLASPMDVEDVSLPRRQIIGNLCQWTYRSAECSFASVACIAEIDDTPIPPEQQVRSVPPLYDPLITYAHGDIVYILGVKGLKRYFRCFNPCTGVIPPHPQHWTEDACSKRIHGCKLRFGSAYQRSKGLPYGGFPAVSRLPF